MAWNSPIQGTAADIIKLAMVAVDADPAVEKTGAVMLLQVHDELVFEVPRKEMEPLAALAREKMEKACRLSAPLVVDVKTGSSWMEVT